jgi:hypothetical protein
MHNALTLRRSRFHYEETSLHILTIGGGLSQSILTWTLFVYFPIKKIQTQDEIRDCMTS